MLSVVKQIIATISKIISSFMFFSLDKKRKKDFVFFKFIAHVTITFASTAFPCVTSGYHFVIAFQKSSEI